MHPFIKDGDVITVAPLPPTAPGLGDVVVFVHEKARRLFVHRVTKKIGGSFVTRGDSARVDDDRISKTNLLGRVTHVERNGKRVRLGLAPERSMLGLMARLGLLSPIVFQGGVAANQGIQKSIERELETSLIIPEHFDVMGAIGAAKLIKKVKPVRTQFRGFDLPQKSCSTRGFECGECGNQCEVIQLLIDDRIVACWGDLCERYRQA